MHNWRCFPQAVRLDDIDDVLLAIPCDLDRGEGMVPTKVRDANPGKGVGDLEGLAFDRLFRDREDAA